MLKADAVFMRKCTLSVENLGGTKGQVTCANQTACDFLPANIELECTENVQCTCVP